MPKVKKKKEKKTIVRNLPVIFFKINCKKFCKKITEEEYFYYMWKFRVNILLIYKNIRMRSSKYFSFTWV